MLCLLHGSELVTRHASWGDVVRGLYNSGIPDKDRLIFQVKKGYGGKTLVEGTFGQVASFARNLAEDEGTAPCVTCPVKPSPARGGRVETRAEKAERALFQPA